MKALILAAGYGTRLAAVTLNTAKPLLEVTGQPMINHLVNAIGRVDTVDALYIVTNAKFYADFENWRNTLAFDRSVQVINDGTLSNEERLGAIGDICLVVEQQGMDDDLLIVGGDNLFQFDLANFVRFFLDHGPSVGLYRLPSLELASRYGNVELDQQGRIIWFEEKPERPRTPLIATCIYCLSRNQLRMLSAYRESGAKMDAPGLFIRWLAQQTDVYGFVCEGLWFDIGDPRSLEEARSAFSSPAKQ